MNATRRIRELNDRLRHSFEGGRVTITRGIAALPESARSAVLKRVQSFTEFNPDNDPHGEHDFGSLQEQGRSGKWLGW